MKKTLQRRRGKAIAAASHRVQAPFQSLRLLEDFAVLQLLFQRRMSEAAEFIDLRAICGAAREEIERFDRSIVTRSTEAVVTAELGRPARRLDFEDSALARTSLPATWSALTRPVGRDEQGRAHSGIEWLARSSVGANPRIAPIVERLRRARVVFGPIVAMNPGRLEFVVRDAIDGRDYTITSVSDDMRSLTRWSVALTFIAPVDAERWIYPSIINALPPRCAPSLEQMFEGIRASLLLTDPNADEPAFESAISADERAAAAEAFLLRHLGLAFATFIRLGAQLEAATRQKRFPVTTDGDAAAPTRVVFDLRATPSSASRAIATAPGVRRTSPTGWSWVESRAAFGAETTLEGIATVSGMEDPPSPGFESRWTLNALSPQRVDRALETLATILRETPVIHERSTQDLAEDSDSIVKERGPGVQDVILAEWISPDRSTNAGVAAPIERLRAMLDQVVPILEGKPRERATTEEGRAAVEAWLRDAETLGDQRPDVSQRWIDLDPLREELGLPRVEPRHR